MPVRYSENDLALKRLKGKLLGKIRQMEEATIDTTITDRIVTLESKVDNLEVKEVVDEFIRKI